MFISLHAILWLTFVLDALFVAMDCSDLIIFYIYEITYVKIQFYTCTQQINYLINNYTLQFYLCIT